MLSTATKMISPMLSRARQPAEPLEATPLRLVLPLLALYVVITILGLHYHELSLEEAQFFLLGRDSTSLSALYHNMQYEGHPRLWCSLLFLIIHYITPGYAGMQVLHLAVTTATVFLFLRYAPFSLLSKVLIIGGYYFLFEYDILSRSYSLGILLLFGCCILLRNPAKNMGWIGLLALLLCNTHLFFSFTAIGIFAWLFVEMARQRRLLSWPFLGFSVLVLTGVVTMFLQGRIPPEDKLVPIIPGGWHTAKNFSAASYAIIRGWLPIPNVSSANFWNTYWLDDNHIGGVLRTLLFGGLLVFPALILKPQVKALLFYYTSIGLLFIFFLVLPMVASRYFGVGYIVFLAACWMAADERSLVTRHDPSVARRDSLPSGPDFFSFRHIPGPRLRTSLRVALYAIFTVQVLVGIYALAQDYSRPFSQAMNAVAYIKEHRLDNQEMIVEGYIAGPALSVYSGKPLYYLNIGQKGSYCVWRNSYFPHPAPTLRQEITRSGDFLRGLDKFILVSNRQMEADLIRSGDSHFTFAFLSGFPNSITAMENSYIYQATRKINDQLPAKLSKL